MAREPEIRSLRQHIGLSGTLIPGLFLGLAVLSLAVAVWSRHHAVTASAAWLCLQALLFVELRFRLVDRAETNERTGEGNFTPPAFLGSALVLWLLLTASVGLGYHAPVLPFSPGKSAVAIVTLAMAMGLHGALLHYYQGTSASTLAEAKGLASWCRASIWLSVASLISVLLLCAGLIEAQKPIVQGLLLALLIPVLEWLVRTLAREDGGATLVRDVRVIPLLFGRLNPVQSLLDTLERKSTVDVRSTWALTFLRRFITPLAAGLLLVAWLSSSVVTVGALEGGLLERFGASVAHGGLEPGLHLKAPWPIEQLRLVRTARVRTLPLGYVGPTEGASLLWTRSHAAQEHRLLLGDGRDLVTVNATLQYRVQDPWLWHYGTQNPEEALRVAAEQALLSVTVNRSLDEVLSENTAVLARHIEDAIRQRVLEYAVGAQILGLSLQGLHPPVRVAQDYQAVISAQHEREIAVLASRQYEIEAVHAAQIAAIEKLADAKATGAATVAGARGAADAFLRLQSAHAASPDSFELRQRLNALEGLLKHRPFAVIDHRIEEDGGVLWLEN